MSEYHREQLIKLKKSEYFKSIKVFDGEGNSTKQLALNVESIPVIIKFLEKELKQLNKNEVK
jgi:hypothetical protein